MPKVIYEFDIPEDGIELEIFQLSNKTFSAINRAQMYIRTEIKHHEHTDNEIKLMKNISEMLEVE
jgi:hypothetical protein